MRHIFITMLALLLALTPQLCRADDFSDEIPEGAGGKWLVGFRAGAEFHVGRVGDNYYQLKASLPTPDLEMLFEGPDIMGYAEYTLSDHLRAGFEAGAQVAVIGEAANEEHFTTIVWGPYLRAVAFPGKITPYALVSAQLYHGFAGGAMKPLAVPAAFTYSLGGGLEVPLSRDVGLGFEGRFRHFAQEGSDPKVIEAQMMVQFWLE